MSRHGDLGDVFVTTMARGRPKDEFVPAFADGLSTALYGKPTKETPPDKTLHDDLENAGFQSAADGATRRVSFEENKALMDKNYPVKAFVFFRTLEDDDRSHEDLCKALHKCLKDALERSDKEKLARRVLRSPPTYADFSKDNDFSVPVADGHYESLDHVLTDNGVAAIAVAIFDPEGDDSSVLRKLLYRKEENIRRLFSEHRTDGYGYSDIAITKFGFPVSANTKSEVIANRLKSIQEALSVSDLEKQDADDLMLSVIEELFHKGELETKIGETGIQTYKTILDFCDNKDLFSESMESLRDIYNRLEKQKAIIPKVTPGRTGDSKEDTEDGTDESKKRPRIH